jgi:Xaa-Pro aminopeptidase
LDANAQFVYYTIFPRGLGVVDCKNYIVEENSVFGLDVGAAYENYVSDTGLTVFFGNVSNMDYDNYKKCLSVLEAGYRSIKPGVYCSDIFKAMKLTASGLKLDKILYEGHGIGLSFREYPVINGCLDYFYDDGFFSRNADFVLQENMVFNLEVSWFCLYQKSIQIEKTFFVTKNGCQELDFQQRNEPVVI